MPTPPTPGRRGSLSKALIVDRALFLAREYGPAAVTMRRIAADLGVEAMSLYHHIPTKATLLVLMADRSLSRISPPDEALPWHDQLVELLVQTYLAGVENPVLFEVIASEPLAEHHVRLADAETGASSADFVELVLALLDRSALPLEQQVDAYRGLIGLLIGFMVVKTDGFLRTVARHRQPAAAPADPAGEVPVTTPDRLSQIGPALEDAEPVAALEASLRWFLRGLEQTHGSSPD